MKAMNFMMCETMSHPSYNAPSMEVVEINFEQGFTLSSDSFGLGDGTSYDEEDVNW
jgi:hypothetical protein